MGDVLEGVKILILCGDFDPTTPTPIMLPASGSAGRMGSGSFGATDCFAASLLRGVGLMSAAALASLTL